MGKLKNISLIGMLIFFTVYLIPGSGHSALVAHWKFDEAPGSTTVVDAVGGLEGDLSLTGAALVGGGRSGGALSLDKGTGGYVNMGDVLSMGTGPYSFVTWVKTSTQSGDFVMSKHNSGNAAGYIIGVNVDNTYGVPGKAWFYNVSPGDSPFSATTVNDGQWHQIVGVRGNGFVKIYVDGLPVENSQIDQGLNNPQAGTPFVVGGLSSGGTPVAYYTGLVDDIQVYDHALSDSEIQWLFDHPGQPVCAQAPSGIVSWWKAEGNGNDSRGRNTGTLFGGPGFVSGRVNQAFSFDGSTQYLQVANPKDIPVGNAPRTILAWIKWAGENGVGHQNIFAYGSWLTYAGTFFFERRSSTQKLYLTGYNTELLGNTVIAPDIWYLVAITHDGTTSKFYVNGVEDGSAPLTHNTLMNGEGIKIGDAPGNDGNHGKFNGLIDEVTVFNRALSQQEIAAIYGAAGEGLCACAPSPMGLVSQWKAEGNTSDFIGNHHGTWVNGPGYAAGEVGQAFDFDGVDDYVDITTLTSQNFPDAFTISGWVEARSLPGTVVNLAGFPGGYQLNLLSDGKISFGNSGLMVNSNSSLAANVYRHVTASFEAGRVKVYIDGNLDNEGTTTIYGGAAVSFQIGGFGGFPTTFFNGMIDELQVYSRALQPTEVAALHQAGGVGLCGQFDAIPGLRLWLKADSGLILGGTDSVTTWEDRSGNGLDVAQATEANRPTKVSANLNSLPVVRFDGNNNYLIRLAVPGYDLFDNNADTVFIVQKQAGADPRSSTFSWTSDGFNRFMVHATWDDSIYFQASANAGGGDQLGAPQPYGWDDRWHLLKLVKDGINGQINVDGIGLTPTVTSFSPGNNLPSADLYVGSDYWTANNLYSSTNWFTGDIAEILVFNRALTTQEQQTVDIYLREKYGLTNTPDGFTIPDKVDQPLNSVIESTAIMVSGINILAPISISAGGEYAVNNGAYTSTAGIVVNGDSVMVRQTSSASFSTTTDVMLTIGGVSGTFSVTTRDQAADLSIVKTSAPATPVLGQPLTYTLTVTNAGPDTAEQVIITDVLPAGLTFISASAPCSYENANRTVACALGSLSNGAQQSVDIEVISNVAGPVSNTATVASSISDPGGGNNSAIRDVSVEVHLFLPLIIKNQ